MLGDACPSGLLSLKLHVYISMCVATGAIHSKHISAQFLFCCVVYVQQGEHDENRTAIR